MSQLHTWKSFLVPKLHRIVEFLTSQGLATAARLLYGFLCVRLLSVPEYAKFAVVFGFLGTLALLMDIAFTATLLPLVGEHIEDRQLIADYLASLRQLSRQLYFLVAPLAALLYPLLVHKQQWGWQTVTVMVVILLIAAWCNRVSGAYGAVLIVRRDRRYWYAVQVIASIGALALLAIFWGFHKLNAFSAILISLVAIVYTTQAYYLRAHRLLGVTGHGDREKRNAIVHLAMPSVPNAIFYALQGQIALLLITLFGRASAVAGVGALGRLAQIFVLFGQMNPLLLEPYFAVLPESRLRRNYIVVLVLEAAFCLLVTGAAAAFPQIFLWILGHNYSGLRREVVLMMASSSLAYFSGVLWVIHNARKFVYWWNGAVTIILTLAVEIVFIWKVDLSTVRSVLLMNLAVAVPVVLINIYTGIHGFIYGPRRRAVRGGDELVQSEQA